jgi:thiol:disulfide interchange protein
VNVFRSILFTAIAILLFTAAQANAQGQIRWTLAADDGVAEVTKRTKFSVKLVADLDDGWSLYALDQPPGGPIATTIKVTEGSPFEISGKIESPPPIVKPDPNFIVDDKPLISRFYNERAIFSVPVSATADTTTMDLSLDVRFMICSETTCHPAKTLRVSRSGTVDPRAIGAAAPVSTPSFTVPVIGNTDTASQQPTAEANSPSTTLDLWPFIWLAITLGALSLLTPCVFPMIPITVSYFTNHAAGDRGRSLKLASVYSLGIIGTFTLVGMLLAIFVGAAGINLFASSPWINLLITAIFLFFAFNLFGAYEITIPSGLLSRLDTFTRSKEGEGGGIIGALLMGLTFTLTSFTCTSPFVGTILVSASQGEWQRPLIGMLAFSTVFALPFFVLALAPQLMSQLPRAGGWMNSVKVTMGFLEVAAAMKFLSNVDLVWNWGIFTREVILAVWIAIGIVLAIYLLGKFQLAHDSKPERLGSIRMMSAVVSLAVSFYLLTGLFGARLGELEAFLPPATETTKAMRNSSNTSINWIKNDLDAALMKGKAEDRLIFLDFTGYTCTNCRWMEANVFPRPEVEAQLAKFVLVQLYTDGNGEVYERNQKLEQDMFGTVALPFYAIVDSEMRTIATFPGLTRNVAEFVDFLKKGEKN